MEYNGNIMPWLFTETVVAESFGLASTIVSQQATVSIDALCVEAFIGATATSQYYESQNITVESNTTSKFFYDRNGYTEFQERSLGATTYWTTRSPVQTAFEIDTWHSRSITTYASDGSDQTTASTTSHGEPTGTTIFTASNTFSNGQSFTYSSSTYTLASDVFHTGTTLYIDTKFGVVTTSTTSISPSVTTVYTTSTQQITTSSYFTVASSTTLYTTESFTGTFGRKFNTIVHENFLDNEWLWSMTFTDIFSTEQISDQSSFTSLLISNAIIFETYALPTLNTQDIFPALSTQIYRETITLTYTTSVLSTINLHSTTLNLGTFSVQTNISTIPTITLTIQKRGTSYIETTGAIITLTESTKTFAQFINSAYTTNTVYYTGSTTTLVDFGTTTLSLIRTTRFSHSSLSTISICFHYTYTNEGASPFFAGGFLGGSPFGYNCTGPRRTTAITSFEQNTYQIKGILPIPVTITYSNLTEFKIRNSRGWQHPLSMGKNTSVYNLLTPDFVDSIYKTTQSGFTNTQFATIANHSLVYAPLLYQSPYSWFKKTDTQTSSAISTLYQTVWDPEEQKIRGTEMAIFTTISSSQTSTQSSSTFFGIFIAGDSIDQLASSQSFTNFVNEYIRSVGGYAYISDYPTATAIIAGPHYYTHQTEENVSTVGSKDTFEVSTLHEGDRYIVEKMMIGQITSTQSVGSNHILTFQKYSTS